MRLRRRLDVALGAIAGVMLILAMGGSAAAQGPGPELLPDLQALNAHQLTVTSGGGTRDLRLSTSVANAGAGVLEIYPVGGADCDGDGNSANDRTAFQRVFRDGDGNLYFTRLADTDSVSHQAGCMIFHPAHSHWHLEDFARYELRAVGTGEVVAATTKVSFCVIDTSPFAPALPGFDTARYYDDCGEDSTEGLSVGWGDTYVSSLPGQSIDIRGLPDGDYCLAVTGDPSDVIRESDESNNEAEMRITLAGNSVAAAGSECVGGTAVSSLTQSSIDAPQPAAGKRCKKKTKRRKCRRRA